MENTSSTTVYRYLDGLEKAFWLLDQHRPVHFCIAAEVIGTTSPDDWRDALNLVGRRTPLFGSRIYLDEIGNPYFSLPEESEFSLTVIKGDLDDWERHVAVELGSPFDAAIDPLVRGRLLHTEDHSVLILAFHHSVSDGSSSAYFLRNVLKAAGGLSPDISQDTTSLEQSVDDMKWGDADIPADGDPRLPAARFGGSRTAPPTIATRTLSAEATAALRVRARRENTTVHAALSVAAAQAFETTHPDFETIPPRVFSPIDARRRLLAAGDALGVFVTGIVTRSDDHVVGFWHLARNITGKFATLSDPAALASKVLLVRTVMADVSSPQVTADIWAQVFGAEILLTNLASIDMPTSFGDLALNHLWGPALSVGLEEEQSIGVFTLRSVMHLMHTTHYPADGFLDELLSALATAMD